MGSERISLNRCTSDWYIIVVGLQRPNRNKHHDDTNCLTFYFLIIFANYTIIWINLNLWNFQKKKILHAILHIIFIRFFSSYKCINMNCKPFKMPVEFEHVAVAIANYLFFNRYNDIIFKKCNFSFNFSITFSPMSISDDEFVVPNPHQFQYRNQSVYIGFVLISHLFKHLEHKN